jgi:hypothetical protein
VNRAHGQIRRGQIIGTYGPGALIDLPNDSAIIGGLETWPKSEPEEEILEPRLSQKLQSLTGIPLPRLYAPPPESNDPREKARGIGAFRFPEWFVVQEKGGDEERGRSRRLVHRRALDQKREFEGLKVVATRFVRACPKGHVDDLDWRYFVHGAESTCRRQLWLDERGTGGDLADLTIRCECEKSRPFYEAAMRELDALGPCRGTRPWLGKDANEACGIPSRLLTRTASNAYFAQIVSVLSLPDRGSAVAAAVRALWDDLQIVEDEAGLEFIKKKPQVAASLVGYSNADILAAIQEIKTGSDGERPVKEVELEAILAAPEGYGDDVPVDPDFHARRLPESAWRRSQRFGVIEAVIQLHRLREVRALTGFSRFEAVTPDIHGEYDPDPPVELAQVALEPKWFPAVENRGEGVFLQLRADAVSAWLGRDGVKERLDQLLKGHERWMKDRESERRFPAGPYVLLHTLSHLLIQSLAMRCGYPASSIRERIYAEYDAGKYGILLYTASPDADGTLGGLVQQARHMEDHLLSALQAAELCSNDPICAGHEPGESIEGRWLHGSACHGCALIAETSCEMRNDYLDRALVVPVMGEPDAAFFQAST